MNLVNFCQHLLDNGYLPMPEDQRGCKAKSPKIVSEVAKQTSATGKGKDYLLIMFKDSNNPYVLQYPFTNEILAIENIFKRNDKLNKI